MLCCMPRYDHFPQTNISSNEFGLPPEEASFVASYLEFIDKINAVAPGLLDYMETEFQRFNSDPADPRGVVVTDTHDLYTFRKLVLKRALNKQPVSAQINDAFQSQLQPLFTLDRTMQVTNIFNNILKLDRTRNLDMEYTPDNVVESLSKQELSEAYVAQLTNQLHVRNSSHWTLEELEHYLYSGLHATYLSGKPSAYRTLNQTMYNEIDRIRTEMGPEWEMLNLLREFTADQPQQLNRFIRELGRDAGRIIEQFNRVELQTLIYLASEPRRVIGKLKNLREQALHFAGSVSYNPQVVNALALASSPSAEQVLSSQPEQLNWQILPPGELVNYAGDIIQANQSETSGSQPYVDLNRLNILENLRQWWGPERSYYAKGVRTGRRNVKNEFIEVPDEYIMLILQVCDQCGVLLYENAIAESPIAGHNALYIQRFDANGWQWQELMTHPKSDVLAMGARRLMHDPADPYMVHNMTERTKILLTVHPQAFLNSEFHGFDREGKPYLHIPRNVMDIILAEQNNQ